MEILNLILKLLKPVLTKTAPLVKKPMGASLIVLAAALIFLVLQNRHLRGLVAQCKSTESRSSVVTVTGPVQTVEKVIYRDGPTKTIEKIKYVNRDSSVRYEDIWDKSGFDVPPLSRKKHWQLLYSFVGLSEQGHGLSLGRHLGPLTVSAGPLYFPESKRLRALLGLSYSF